MGIIVLELFGSVKRVDEHAVNSWIRAGAVVQETSSWYPLIHVSLIESTVSRLGF